MRHGLDVAVGHLVEDAVHAGIGADPLVVPVRLEGGGEIVFTLVRNPRNLPLAGEVAEMAAAAGHSLRQRLAPRVQLRLRAGSASRRRLAGEVRGDFVEILTTKSGRGPSRDWLAVVKSSRARNKIRQWYQRETRGETEAKGRELLDQALKAQKLPYRKLQGSSVLAQVIRETGFKKAEDFYVALGAGKLPPAQIVNKVIQRLKTDEGVVEPAVTTKPARARTGM